MIVRAHNHSSRDYRWKIGDVYAEVRARHTSVIPARTAMDAIDSFRGAFPAKSSDGDVTFSGEAPPGAELIDCGQEVVATDGGTHVEEHAKAPEENPARKPGKPAKKAQ